MSIIIDGKEPKSIQIPQWYAPDGSIKNASVKEVYVGSNKIWPKSSKLFYAFESESPIKITANSGNYTSPSSTITFTIPDGYTKIYINLYSYTRGNDQVSYTYDYKPGTNTKNKTISGIYFANNVANTLAAVKELGENLPFMTMPQSGSSNYIYRSYNKSQSADGSVYMIRENNTVKLIITNYGLGYYGFELRYNAVVFAP